MPQLAQDVLSQVSALENVGLYANPYKHQVDALEAFLGDEKSDLIVATGTGSGKTESFRDKEACREAFMVRLERRINKRLPV